MPKKKRLILPNQDKDGRFYVSYSQVKTWNDIKGFNTQLPGKWEYMLKYFFRQSWPDKGWAEFGNRVETALETREFDGFEKDEVATLKDIKVLDQWQTEIKIPLPGDIYLLGYIDNSNPDFSHIRDYKTASENSKEQYYKDKYVQLDIYAEGVKVLTGKYPDRMDVVMVERKGNPWRNIPLTVGKKIWTREMAVNTDRIDTVLEQCAQTAEEIAEHYAVFKQFEKVT